MSNPISLTHWQQSAEGYCLPACVRMVLNPLGLVLSEREIGALLGSQDFGTPSFAVLRLTTLGLVVDYHEWSISQLLALLQAGIPLMVFVRTAFLEYWKLDVAHALVVVGAVENQHWIIHDPAFATGPTTVSWDGLLAAWAEFSYRGASITRPQ